MTDSRIVLELLRQSPIDQRRIELVERKGKGHPDSICDAIAEEVSLALCREYQSHFGRILHHNTDKAMLVAGVTEPRLGGGSIKEPMRFVLGDRAACVCDGKRIDVGGIAEATARAWIRDNLRYVDPTRHLIFQNELKEGSPELTDIFARTSIGANDTSAAVGYAPLSETERLVLEAEQWLNSAGFQSDFPEAGEDVKVMGIREDRELRLTIALAMVDRFVSDPARYFARKEQMRESLLSHLTPLLSNLDHVSARINTLDDPVRGENGMYLTVLGTSAEGADCGQVGRGNRVNGLIPLNRPMSTEAAAGKNPVSHVGKIYSLLSHAMADSVVRNVEGVAEIYVWLCSQIGQPIDRPQLAAAHLVLHPGAGLSDVQPEVEAILKRELSEISTFCARLARGEFHVW